MASFEEARVKLTKTKRNKLKSKQIKQIKILLSPHIV